MKRLFTEDGTDVTESVQIMYDVAHASAGWDYGMFDNEEVSAVIELAAQMGWKVPDLNESMVTMAVHYPDHYFSDGRIRPKVGYRVRLWVGDRKNGVSVDGEVSEVDDGIITFIDADGSKFMCPEGEKGLCVL